MKLDGAELVAVMKTARGLESGETGIGEDVFIRLQAAPDEENWHHQRQTQFPVAGEDQRSRLRRFKKRDGLGGIEEKPEGTMKHDPALGGVESIRFIHRAGRLEIEPASFKISNYEPILGPALASAYCAMPISAAGRKKSGQGRQHRNRAVSEAERVRGHDVDCAAPDPSSLTQITPKWQSPRLPNVN
jgi:hypothetical protein